MKKWMKNLVCFAMVLACVLMGAVNMHAYAEEEDVSAASGPWPVREMEGRSVILRPAVTKGMMRMAFYGPDSQYTDAGAYEPGKVVNAIALFKEGDYILVNLNYNNTMRRCVYFKENMLRYSDVEEVTPTRYTATVLSEGFPRMGPGLEYDEVINPDYVGNQGETKSARITLEKGMEVDVFFETDGWAHIEFYSSMGLIRAWIPVSLIA